MRVGEVQLQDTAYGTIATAFESPSELRTLLAEVEEYFDCGATVSPGDTVVDVGANIGAFAIAVAARTHGQVHLHCFEPVPSLFRALRENLTRNEHLRVSDHHAYNLALSALGEEQTDLPFFYFRHFPRDSTMDLPFKQEEFVAFAYAQGKRLVDALAFLGPGAKLLERGIAALPIDPVVRWGSKFVMGLEELRVPCDTLAGAILSQSLARIDLLKIDVEGAEQRVLAGIDEPTWSKIRQIALECDGLPATVDALRRTLAKHGFGDSKIYTPPSMRDRGLPNVLIYARRQNS